MRGGGLNMVAFTMSLIPDLWPLSIVKGLWKRRSRYGVRRVEEQVGVKGPH
jgi:hypothetical protein